MDGIHEEDAVTILTILDISIDNGSMEQVNIDLMFFFKFCFRYNLDA